MKTVLKKLMLFFLLLGITACGQNNNSSSQVDFSLIPVRTNYLWGYVNPKGEVVIPEIFADVNFFSDGLACVSDFNGNEGFIDKNGNESVTAEQKAEQGKELALAIQANVLEVLRKQRRPGGMLG